MKVGGSKQSSQSSKSEGKKEVTQKSSPAGQENKPKTTAAEKPKISLQKDSFEPVKPKGSVVLTESAPSKAASALARNVAPKAVPGQQNVAAQNMKNALAAGPGANLQLGAQKLSTTAGVNTAATPSTTGANAQAILETGRNNPTEAADQLAQTLTDPSVSQQEKVALVTSIIEQDPHTSAQILDAAGRSFDLTGKLTDAERQAIATTVGQAWDQANPSGRSPATPGTPGALDAADLRALLSPNNMNAFPEFGAQPHNLGNVFAASGSSSLQHSAATQMYNIGREIAAGNPVDGSTPDYIFKNTFADSYLAGSAQAASGSPQAAQGLMDHVARFGDEAIQDFVQRTAPEKLYNSYGPGASHALGKLMQAVGDQPATPAADKFFDQAAAVSRGSGNWNEEQGVSALQQGLAQYFQANMEHTTTRWASSNQIADRTAYAHFAANVLFGDSFEGQKELQTSFATHLGQRAGELQGAQPGDPAMEEKSRQLGFLIGGAEVGFQRALGFVKDRNEAREAMVDFVFDMASAAADVATGGRIPNFEFGPVDIRGSITQQLKEQVYNWVREEEPSANEMTRPMYETGLSISNDYHDEMQAVRGSFADDERYGYLQ